MTFDKKLILQVVPYVLSGAALIWCMKQCSSIDDVQDVNDAQSNAISVIDNRADSLAAVTNDHGQAIKRVAGMIGGINERVNAAMDSIDSINVRVDSMRIANKEMKARVDSLAQAAKACKKVKVAKAKKKPAAVVPVRPQRRMATDTVARVNVLNGGTGNTNVVNINNGGTINNYYGTPAVKAEPAKAAQCNKDVVFTYRRLTSTQVVVEITR